MSSSRALGGDTPQNPLDVDAAEYLLARARPLRGHTAGRAPASEPVPTSSRGTAAANARSSTGGATGLRINRGPPSTIPLSLSDRHRPAVTPADEDRAAARTRARISRELQRDHEAARDMREARAAALVNPGRTRLVTRRDPALDDVGQRDEREEPLTREALWLTDGRPDDIPGCKPHHLCGICHGPKSHPVSYMCGHSHCYVCIRVWLGRSWACPVCKTIMRNPPFRHFGEEDSLAYDYPDWVDNSCVDYSWDGLRFPKPPRMRIVPDTP
ncbi:hypothetical protein B0H11DRAFT_2266722 [Mycena galericulata]|nr:hypothetical protein B0H11DRAFT_2266722 [Mycena galericulata]